MAVQKDSLARISWRSHVMSLRLVKDVPLGALPKFPNDSLSVLLWMTASGFDVPKRNLQLFV